MKTIVFQYLRWLLLFPLSLNLSLIPGSIFAQVDPPKKDQTNKTTTYSTILFTQLDDVTKTVALLDSKVENLTKQLESELRIVDMRFEAMAQSTDRAFNMLFVLGALGSFVGGLLILSTWIRDRQRHRDYEHERQFYEQQVLRQDEMQRKIHGAALDLSTKAATRDANLVEQQLNIGAKTLSRADDVLSGQIDGMSKLGDVIELVQKTFKIQLEREEKHEKLSEQLEEMERILSSLSEHYKGQYARAVELIISLRHLSRIEWTSLSPEERNVARRARTIFEGIPMPVVERAEIDEPYTVAQVYQLLGVSAFYNNDVEEAEKYLHNAQRIFSKNPSRPEDLYPKAFASHFLGLIDKNWLKEGRSLGANLEEAKSNLELAVKLLQVEENEVLTPLTLAEVLSYIEREWNAAKQLLDRNIKFLEAKKDAGESLDNNQKALLGRAYLLRGNIEFHSRNVKDALSWYKKAESQLEVKHYANLSIAQVTNDVEERRKCFERGLNQLEDSHALQKSEITVRLTALAWAVIAAREIGDDKQLKLYQDDFDSLGLEIRTIAGREPLFFCPLAKRMVNFKQLRHNVTTGSIS